MRRDISDDELAADHCGGGERPGVFRAARGPIGRLRTSWRRVRVSGADELASMTRASFALEGDAPTVRVAAGYSKRGGRMSNLSTRRLPTALAGWLAGKADGVRVLPLPRKTAEMLRGRYAAGAGTVDQRGDEAQERRERREALLTRGDGEGRVFDFHALRHHYISRVVQSGASVRCAKSLPGIPRPS